MSGTKQWYDITLQHLEHWAEESGLPWAAIKPHLLNTVERARVQWPEMLERLPMLDEHKQLLRQHWGMLHVDFSIQLI